MRAITATVMLILSQAMLAMAAFPTQAAAPDTKLLTAIKSCDHDARGLLERLVAIDSGTGDADGLAAVAAINATELKLLGATLSRVPPPFGAPAGDNLVATLTGSGKGRILLISHMDTVFNRGDVDRLKPHWEGDRYVGPGANDDKAGAVTAICALKALKAIGFKDFARIDILLNASEEVGSPGSRDLIRSMARNSDLVINQERGIPGDKVLVARKGSAVLTVDFAGRAAHSGLEPEKGRNAALEAARVALALGGLSDPTKETTVTVDIISGGDKINVVPDRAVVKADVRAFTPEEFDRVEAAAAALAAHPSIDGVTIKSELKRNFPAWPHLPSTDATVAKAQKIYAELGRSLTTTRVGSSADINFAAESGTPGIDGFSVEGDGAHTIHDTADLSTLTPRAYLLARLIMVVGHDPKGK